MDPATWRSASLPPPLRVGAAVGVHDYERADALIKAGVDILAVDSAHGHSSNVVETVKKLKKTFAAIEVISLLVNRAG